ncbi:MAG: hypothetical protein MUE84_15115 [Hyphomonas sp.]|jgi:hypothetical protein|nr:hypothetical protein [Hyphomonas sp.]
MGRSSAAQLGFGFEPGDEDAALIATEPATAEGKPSKGEEIKARIAANREKRLRIAEAMKQEAGVTGHEINTENFAGLAFIGTGRIKSPEGRNIRQLYTVAHECGHIFLHNELPGLKLPAHLMEMEAESYAHQAFREHGMTLPRWLSDWGRTYVGSWVEKDRANGIAIDPRAVAYANGTRSPYEPLRMVPKTWTVHGAIPLPSQRFNGLRRSIERWLRPQPGSLRSTLFDIGRFVLRGFILGTFVTLLGLQLSALPKDSAPVELTSATLFTLATGGLVGACLMLLRRPVVPPRRRKTRAGRKP